MKQLDRRFLNQRSYASTRVDFNQVGARSIVTRGLLVCDGAHVSDDGTKGRKQGMRTEECGGAACASASCEAGRVRALRVTTRLVLFEAI